MTSWYKHSIRFAVVGIGSNVVLYVLYLGLTWLGIGHKSAMSGLFVFGMAQTFLLNKTWTFAHGGKTHAAFGRYLVAYALGYLLNLWMLVFLVDGLGLPHQTIQGLAILAVAATMFLIQRYWVFASRKT